ncbi:hypothetical protein L1887_22555 [Cichorium endivia]|nr:hypothetical protein L1887_22555 [Cichorium endivia]
MVEPKTSHSDSLDILRLQESKSFGRSETMMSHTFSLIFPKSSPTSSNFPVTIVKFPTILNTMTTSHFQLQYFPSKPICYPSFSVHRL